MNAVFERATPADAEKLVEVQIAAFHSEANLYPGVEVSGPPGYDSLESALQKMRDHAYYKMVYEGQIVGGMVVFDQGGGHHHLDLLYIDPDYHNRGIGTRAIEFIEQTHPATKWTLDTPGYATRNHHFYEKFGYVKMKEVAYDGFTLIAYEK